MADLDVGGGAGGMAARLGDLRAQSAVMGEAGQDLLGRVGPVSGVATDGDVLAAALVCPDVVPGVEAAVLAAAVGPGGLAVRGGALTVSSTVIDASVATYEFVDETAAATIDAAERALSFAAGTALPGLAFLALTNPFVLGGVATWTLTGDPAADLQETLYDNPWMLEVLTRAAPGLVQGSAYTLTGGGLGSIALLHALTGGRWPTGDYEDSVAGLIALGGHGGFFDDGGDFVLGEGVSRGPDDPDHPFEWTAEHAVEDVFTMQDTMDSGLSPQEHAAQGQLQIIAVPQADGSTAYVVQIPGTEDWNPERTGNPVDLTSNVHLMTQENTVWRQFVIDAIRDQVPPGSQVMLTGHSQGGITAASIASDPAVVRELGIRGVVTGGSPIGRFDIDPSVSVLALEHEQDPVPMLDGTGNPDRPNWTTVRRDLPDEYATRDGVTSPGTAHLGSNYANTGARVDASDDPSVAAWREQNAHFFSGSGDPTVTRYDVERAP